MWWCVSATEHNRQRTHIGFDALDVASRPSLVDLRRRKITEKPEAGTILDDETLDAAAPALLPLIAAHAPAPVAHLPPMHDDAMIAPLLLAFAGPGVPERSPTSSSSTSVSSSDDSDSDGSSDSD